MKNIQLIICTVIALVFTQCTNSSQERQEKAYIFYYFEGAAGEKAGLHSAYSYDLKNWQPLTARSFQPDIGEYKVFRDPTVMRTSDGIFHMAWTCGSSGFGYAHSDDGLKWEDERFITVEDTTRGMVFANVWAPDFYQEGDSVYIIWSSTLIEDYVPPKVKEEWWTSTWNHHLFYNSTSDFQSFSPSKRFWNPDHQVIDAALHKEKDTYYLFYKDARKGNKKILLATANQMLGEYENSIPITYEWTEGAIPVQTDTAMVMYYDNHDQNNGYRYMTSKDYINWSTEYVPGKVGFEDILRHGDIVEVDKAVLEVMLSKVQNKN